MLFEVRFVVGVASLPPMLAVVGVPIVAVLVSPFSKVSQGAFFTVARIGASASAEKLIQLSPLTATLTLSISDASDLLMRRSLSSVQLPVSFSAEAHKIGKLIVEWVAVLVMDMVPGRNRSVGLFPDPAMDDLLFCLSAFAPDNVSSKPHSTGLLS